MEHEVLYDRNLSGSYMKIPAREGDSFDEKILLRQKQKGLLGMELSYYNGEPWYWYNISGKQSLDVFSRLQNIGYEFIEQLIISICDEVEIMEWSLLDQNCLVLDPEFIYINNLNREIIFTAYPGYGKELSGQFQGLMEYLLTKLDHSDMRAVQTAYEIYERTLDTGYFLVDIRDFVLQKRDQEGVLQKHSECQKGESSDEETRIPYIEEEDGLSQSMDRYAAQNSDKRNTIGAQNSADKKVKGRKAGFEVITQKTRVWIKQQLESTELYQKVKRLLVDKRSRSDGKGDRKNEKKKEAANWIVYPEESRVSPKVDLHPTVCLASYREHPRGILLYEGADSIENITLGKGEIQIGKDKQADVSIDRDTISQFHARVFFEDEGYYLEDLNSTNGTYVNEEPLCYKESRKLQTDDIVRLADVRFRFL